MTSGQRERLAWLALVAVSLGARFWDLGVRTLSHDESLHAFLSFQFLIEGVYRHDPAYHGPFLYHVNALVYFLLGATDATARLAPSLFGVALVAGLWSWRRYLGPTGAWLAAAFVCVSPTLLFYSRHIRNDIYIACFSLVWGYAVLRYLEGRQRRWLTLLTLAMALSFLTKEVSFITGAVMGSFVGLVAVWPGRWSPRPVQRAAAADLAIHMLALVLPFLSGALFPLLGWSAVGADAETRLVGLGGLVVAGLFALTLGSGAARFGWRPWLPLFGAFWGLQLTFFTTFFTNITGGLTSGIVGSLGYWLTQHEVARAGQPWFYYGLIGPLYEPVPVLVGGVALVTGLWCLRRASWDPVPNAGRDGEDAAAGRDARRLCLPFVAWWAAASWLAYAVAGERMPWLLVHQVLPLCLLAGWGLGRLLDADWTGGDRRARLVLMASTACALVVAVGVLRGTPLAGRTIEAVADSASWWTRVVWLTGLTGLAAVTIAHLGGAVGRRMLLLGLLVPVAVLWVRASLQVNFVNVDMATEPMSYAQASPDVPRVMREIERLDDRLGGHHQLRVAVDDENSWPFSWYLRDYPRTVAWGKTPALAADADVVLVGPDNRPLLAPQVARGYTRQRGILYWWPLQGYSSLTPSSLKALLADPAQREALWQIAMNRRYDVPLHEWSARREFDMYVRDDMAALIGLGPRAGAAARLPAVMDERPWTPRSIASGPFDGRSLLHPTAVAVAQDGTRLIADSGNHRIVVLDADGRLRFTIGRGRCALTEAGQPGCVDPDGTGPRSLGDGQFNEPWGVTTGPAGEIVVADTWNGRIQVFDARGLFVAAWGRFGRVTPGADDTDDPLLFGPRSLVLTADGEFVVADTGNKRLLVFTVEGQRRRVVGPAIDWPPGLDEPTGVAWDANQTLLVADLWNQRVVRLDRSARALAAWAVPGWESRAAEDKAAVAVDADGRVYAVEPASGRVLVFAPSGALEARLVLPASGSESVKPTGIAAADAGQTLLVVDREGGRLLEMPLPGAEP